MLNTVLSLLAWALRLVVFIGLFGLAVKNSDPMELRFYFGRSWQVPVSVVVLGAFGAGALLGLTATVAVRIRRREEPR